MKTVYNFEDDLSSLQILLSREVQFQNAYQTPILEEHIRPLVITLDNWLRIDARIRDSEQRRSLRMAMLTVIIKRPIRSTYDLSLYQCTTITHFLWYGIDGRDRNDEERTQGFPEGLGERAKRFLEDLKNACQAQGY